MQALFDITQPIDKKRNYPFKCECCSKTFEVKGVWIILNLKTKKSGHKFCSKNCQSIKQFRTVNIVCAHCNISITKRISEQKQSKSGRSFCSRSCSAKYNNTHKTTGTRRSKLEKWLEEQLTLLYSDLDVIYNNVNIINSELDIYIPSINLAFELNGIFHYEPIYGIEKLASIQNNDNRRFQACLERGIELVILDTSKESYFKPEKSKKYLDIIKSIIDMKLATLAGLEPA